MSLTYVIADLHGRYDLLLQALINIAAHAEGGTIVTLGDYVDRGPQSAQIINRLMAGMPEPWKLICLKGNHEDMMLETIRRPLDRDWWIGNGGGFTLVSYGHPRRGAYDPSVVPNEHLDWIAKLPLMHVDQHRVYVHAGVDPMTPLDRQKPEVLTWKLYNHNTDVGHKAHKNHRHVVHGHHQFENGPKLYEHRTDLDTYAWHTGRLVIGVFDDDKPGGPIDLIEIKGPSYDELRWDLPAEEANLVKAPD